MRTDPRVVKTLSKLEDSFVSLLKNYSIADMNVRQISDEAGVTRGAFYSHFNDKTEFVEWMTKRLVDQLFEASLVDSRTYFSDELTNYNEHTNLISISAFFEAIAKEYQTYTIVMGDGRLPKFEKSLKHNLIEQYTAFAKMHEEYINFDGFPSEVLASFYANGLVGMVKVWLENGMVYTAHYMARATHKLLNTKDTLTVDNLAPTDFFVE